MIGNCPAAVTDHVEAVGHQGQRVHGISDDDLEQEEDRVDDNQDLDAGGLRHREGRSVKKGGAEIVKEVERR